MRSHIKVVTASLQFAQKTPFLSWFLGSHEEKSIFAGGG